MPDQQPSKIVKVRDLEIQLSAFAKINDLNFVDRMFLEGEERAVGQKAVAGHGKGLYVDANKPSFSSLYVDAKFINDSIAEIRKDPHLSEAARKELDKINGTVAQAIQACPDQSAQLQAGKIKPVAPKM